MDCGVVDHTSANWIPCSAVHNEMVTQRKNATFVVEANIHIVDLVARLTGAQQMFTAVVCTENLGPDVMVMKSTKNRV